MSLAHMPKSSNETIGLSMLNSSQIHSFGAGIVSLNNDFSTFYNLLGEVQTAIPLGYANPKIAFGKNQALVYDIGSNDYLIANSFGILSNHETDSRILSVSVDNETESYAIVTDDAGYNSSLRIYNVHNNEIFKWSTSTYNVLKTELFNNKVATISLKQDGLNLKSYLIVFDTKTGEQKFEYEFTNKFPIDLHIFPDESICVVFQNGFEFFDKNGTFVKNIDTISLQSYNFDTNHKIAYAVNNFDDTYGVYLMDSKGNVESSVTLQDKVTSLNLTSKYVYILAQNTLYKYDMYFNLIDFEYTEVNIINVIAYPNDTIYAVYSNEMQKLFK